MSATSGWKAAIAGSSPKAPTGPRSTPTSSSCRRATRCRLAGIVALYDTGGQLVSIGSPWLEVSAVFVWAGEAWEGLASVERSLHREVLWKAREPPSEAGQRLFRLRAVLEEARQPGFGRTATFDLAPVPKLPAELSESAAGLEMSGLLAPTPAGQFLPGIEQEVGSRLGLEMPSVSAVSAKRTVPERSAREPSVALVPDEPVPSASSGAPRSRVPASPSAPRAPTWCRDVRRQRGGRLAG